MKILNMYILIIALSIHGLSLNAQEQINKFDSLAYLLVNRILTKEIKELKPDPDLTEKKIKFGDSVRLFYRFLDSKVILENDRNQADPLGRYYLLLRMYFKNIKEFNAIAALRGLDPLIDTVPPLGPIYKQLQNSVQYWDSSRLCLDDYLFTTRFSGRYHTKYNFPDTINIVTGKSKNMPLKRNDPDYSAWVETQVGRVGWRVAYPAFFRYDSSLYALIAVQYQSFTIPLYFTVAYLCKWEGNSWEVIEQEGKAK